MGNVIAPSHIAFLAAYVLAGLYLVPTVFYIATLQRTLQKCAPESRTLEPELVWLYLVPLVNLVFHFFVVFGMAKSLRNEFNRRGVASAQSFPGQSIGLAMCVSACCVVVPLLGALAVVAHVVFWVMYWERILQYSHALDEQAHAAIPAAAI